MEEGDSGEAVSGVRVPRAKSSLDRNHLEGAVTPPRLRHG
jgi:hypothetical protein